MAAINIRRDVKDSFYRYKMPQLLIKIEGRGNGIKTVIVNMADVSRALNRPSSYATKFFGFELGAQATFNDVTERYIVNGAHEIGRLRESLDTFIEKFVLCPSCKNPETELIILKDETIIRDCKACGQRVGLDMRHKLSTFIVKNPPKSTKKGAGKKKGTSGADALLVAGVSDAESDDELTKKIEAGATELLSPEAAAALIASKEADDEWSVDTSKEAVAARISALDSKLQASLILGDDEDEDALGGQYDVFGEWLRENRETTTDAEIYKKAEELGLAKKHKVLIVLVQAIFTEAITKEIPDHIGLFTKLTTSEKHQKSLLGGIERFVGVTFPELKAEIPKILMAFYQADILEEDVVTHWGTHASKKYVPKDVSKKVRKAADPFVKWLAEASDDDDEDSE